MRVTQNYQEPTVLFIEDLPDGNCLVECPNCSAEYSTKEEKCPCCGQETMYPGWREW